MSNVKNSHPTRANESVMMNEDNRPVAILLVDDDADCRMLVRDAIEECKVSNLILEASNGHDALRVLGERAAAGLALPGLIYLDIEMPGLDGIETLRRIKGDPKLHHIPVVMMTGVSDETQMRKAAEYGANSYTLKPASAEQFLRTVLASTNYWLAIHQYPDHRLPQALCRR